MTTTTTKPQPAKTKTTRKTAAKSNAKRTARNATAKSKSRAPAKADSKSSDVITRLEKKFEKIFGEFNQTDGELKQATATFMNLASKSLEQRWELGHLLIQIKQALPHGHFDRWLKAHGVSKGTAHNWRKIYTENKTKSSLAELLLEAKQQVEPPETPVREIKEEEIHEVRFLGTDPNEVLWASEKELKAPSKQAQAQTAKIEEHKPKTPSEQVAHYSRNITRRIDQIEHVADFLDTDLKLLKRIAEQHPEQRKQIELDLHNRFIKFNAVCDRIIKFKFTP